MALIDITVKTLDGQNRIFSVPEQMTVRSFKEKISNSIEIPADTQRLIFHGRVMQDEKELREYDIHGKAVHVVQRAPPTNSSTDGGTSSRPQPHHHTRGPGTPDASLLDVQIHFGGMNTAATTREARQRIHQAEVNVGIINDALDLLEQRIGPQGSQESSEQRPESTTATTQQEPQHEDMDTSATPSSSSAERETVTATPATSSSTTRSTDTSSQRGRGQQSTSAAASSQPRSRDSSGSRNQGPEGLSATELADFLDRVLVTSRRMEPHIIRYRDYLNDNQTYTASSQEARSAQEVANRVMEAMHAMSHVMHSLSDVMVDMHTPAPRQAIATPVSPFTMTGTNTMAIPIHMNVRSRAMDNNGNGRGQGRGGLNQAATHSGPTTASATTTTTSTTAAAPAAATSHSATRASDTTGETGGSDRPASQNTSPILVEGIQMGEPIISVHNIQATVMTDDGVIEDAIHFDMGGAPSTGFSIVSTNQTPASAPSTTTTTSSSGNTTSATTSSSNTTTATPTSSSSARTGTTGFSMGPTTNVNVGGGAGGLGNLPNVPGLPGGMLQNIVQSILNNHGVQAGQPVQVNVVHPGGMATQIHRMPMRQDAGQTRPSGANTNSGSSTAGPPNPPPGANNNNGRPPSSNIRPIFINRGRPTPYPIGSPRQAPPSRPLGRGGFNLSATPPPPPPPHAPSSGGGGPQPQAPPSSSSSSSAQQQQHHHHHHHHHPHNNNNRGFVDMYLPCSSHHYLSQTARRAARNNRNQGQQQVPNLSTMVSGMVGDLIGQVGGHVHQHAAAAAAARNNGGNRTTASTSSSTAGTTSSTSSTNAGRAGSNSNNPNPRQSAAPNVGAGGPIPMLAALFGGAGGPGGPLGGPGGPPAAGGPIHLDLTSMIANMMGANMNTPPSSGSRNVSANPTSTTSSSSSSSTPAAPPPPPSTPGVGGPMGGTLADLFRQFTTQLGANDDSDQSEPSFVQALIECVAPHVRLADLFSLVMGNTRVVGQLREPLHRFAQERVTQLGSMDNVVDAALNDMNTEIDFVTSCVEVCPGIDMARSLRACIRHHLQRIIEALLSQSPASQDTFGQELFNLWMTALSQVIALCIFCIRNGEEGFAHMLQQYMPRLTRDLAPAIGLWMGTSVQDILSSFHHNHPVPQADIQVFVVNTTSSTSQPGNEPATSTPTPTPAVFCTSSTAPSATPSKGTSSPSSSSTQYNSAVTATSPIVPMEVADSPSALPPRPKVPRTQQPAKEASNDSGDEFVDAPEEFTSRPAGGGVGVGTRAARPTQIATSPSSSSQVAAGGLRNGEASGQWQDVIPQEWIPVIRQDVERQKEQRSQPPLSDAYLQGLPAKRRRMMVLEHSGEMGNMPHYFPSAIARAARAAGVEPISSQQNMMQEAGEEKELQQSLEEEVQTVVESRISSDSDFNSDRFPNSIRYFQSQRKSP